MLRIVILANLRRLPGFDVSNCCKHVLATHQGRGHSFERPLQSQSTETLVGITHVFLLLFSFTVVTGSTISTLLHDKINPKDCQVLSLGDSGFLQYFRVVSSDYG